MTSDNTIHHDASDGKPTLEFPSPELIEFMAGLGLLMARDLGLAAIDGGPIEFVHVIKCLLSSKLNAWERAFLHEVGTHSWLFGERKVIFDAICRKCGITTK